MREEEIAGALVIELHTIIYTSRDTKFISDEKIETLLVNARSFNESHDVTGVLLYFDLVFFQVLEGPREILESLFERIVEDPRHRDVTLQVSEPIAVRLFPDWSMSYRRLDGSIVRSGDELATVLGFHNTGNNNVVSLQQHRLTKMITAVRRSLGA